MREKFYLVWLFVLALSITGCLEQLFYKTPKCSDDKVLEELSKQLNKGLLYGTQASVRQEAVLFVGENEQTGMKTCKSNVDYSLKNDTNNTIVSLMNAMPIMSDMAKNKSVNYTVETTKDKKDFILKIVN